MNKFFTQLNKKKQQRSRLPANQSGEDSFRRSRTISGSQSGGGNKSKVALETTARMKKHVRVRARRSVAAVFLIVIIAGSGLYYLATQYAFSALVTNYSAGTVKKPRLKQYEQGINHYLASHPGEHFRFALNDERLNTFMQQEFPEVKVVSLQGGGGGKAQFSLTLRRPEVRWQINGHQYFVDSGGVTFERNYFKNPAVEVVDKSGAAVGKDNTVASQGFLGFLGRMIALTNASKIGRVVGATIPPDTTRQIDLQLSGKKYYIKTHIDRDPAAEVEDLKKTVSFLNKKQLHPSYIDIRVPGKAFYR